MTSQLNLFARAPAQMHSAPSKQAAVAIEPIIGQLERRVLDFIAMRGERGATDEQIADAMIRDWQHYNPATFRPRRISLMHKGLVKDSGKTALSRGGRKMALWILACGGF